MVAPKENLLEQLGRRKTEEGPIELSDEDYRAHVIARSIPIDATNVIELGENDTIPEDRYFRNAWVLNGNAVEVNMEKARVIHMDALRVVRNEKLAELDIQFSVALGKKDQTTADAVEAEREILRQIPQTFDLTQATTPEELKALIPSELL